MHKLIPWGVLKYSAIQATSRQYLESNQIVDKNSARGVSLTPSFQAIFQTITESSPRNVAFTKSQTMPLFNL